jgi:hypothetical protein
LLSESALGLHFKLIVVPFSHWRVIFGGEHLTRANSGSGQAGEACQGRDKAARLYEYAGIGGLIRYVSM